MLYCSGNLDYCFLPKEKMGYFASHILFSICFFPEQKQEAKEKKQHYILRID